KVARDKDRARVRRGSNKDAAARSRTEPYGDSEGDADGAEEMRECDTCGAFVATRGARSCGRDDCPYPG
ncbi:MAG: hypothetical protein HN377_04925, partial [Alphaproteobacteria bacterium]|nr:hypothetical protein [Alphaproteobacteria bacterium]